MTGKQILEERWMKLVFMKKSEVWTNTIKDEKVKFSSMKKEEILGKPKSKFLVPKEPVLLLTRGGKTNCTGEYLRPIPLYLNWNSLVCNQQKPTLI